MTETQSRLQVLLDEMDQEKSAIAWCVAACLADGRAFHYDDVAALRRMVANLERLHAEARAEADAMQPVPYVVAEGASS